MAAECVLPLRTPPGMVTEPNELLVDDVRLFPLNTPPGIVAPVEFILDDVLYMLLPFCTPPGIVNEPIVLLLLGMDIMDEHMPSICFPFTTPAPPALLQPVLQLEVLQLVEQDISRLHESRLSQALSTDFSFLFPVFAHW